MKLFADDTNLYIVVITPMKVHTFSIKIYRPSNNQHITVNIPSIAHGPLIKSGLKEGMGSYTDYTNGKDLFVTIPQNKGWAVV